MTGLPGRGALTAAACMALAACASLAPVGTPPAPQAQAFDVAGRLSAHHGQDVLIGNFDWRHAGDRDAIALTTPLGQTMAQLNRDGDGASVELADGRRKRADSFEALTEQAFGVTLPVSGLAWWIRGVPREGSPFTLDRDAAGRTERLRQDGWDIDFAYADESSPQARRLTLAREGVDLRIVIDRWQ